jgi:hypothetical protein
MSDQLTVDEINAKLQEAADKDLEEVFEGPGPYDFKNLDPVDQEGWDEFVERVTADGPPEDLEEEV